MSNQLKMYLAFPALLTLLLGLALGEDGEEKKKPKKPKKPAAKEITVSGTITIKMDSKKRRVISARLTDAESKEYSISMDSNGKKLVKEAQKETDATWKVTGVVLKRKNTNYLRVKSYEKEEKEEEKEKDDEGMGGTEEGGNELEEDIN